MAKKIVISAIDVGTNSFHMVTASIAPNGSLNIVSKDKEVVRLGSSSGDMKYLQRDAVKRGIKTLKAFAKIAENEKARIRAVATSAVREAENKEEFTEKVRNETGIELEVVSGMEEARLIALGVVNAISTGEKRALIIDIGGGSTETIVSLKGENLHKQSTKLGAIRLTKKYFEKIPYTNESIEECKRFIRGEWARVLNKIRNVGYDMAIGSSGTFSTIITMAFLRKNAELPKNINAIEVSSEDVLGVINSIKKANSYEDIAALPGMDSTRIDIILGGALIIEVAIEELGIEKFVLSAYALREGILYDTIHKSYSLQKTRHLSDLRYKTIVDLCHKYDQDMNHLEHIKMLCNKLYDSLVKIHKMGDNERELLEAAAYLHDVGFHISHDKHHKHSYYIIKHSMMAGFTNDEAELIANIARYHRKSHPSNTHKYYSYQSDEKKKIIWLLGGILRIAEGIDRRQIQNVEDIKVKIKEEEIVIKLIGKEGKDYPDIEQWGANRRRAMLEEYLNKEIKIIV